MPLPLLAIPAAKAALSFLPGVGKLFGGAHQAAVLRENQVLENANPAMEQELARIEAEWTAKKITNQDAIRQLDEAMTWYAQQVSGIIKETGGKCNAACVFKGRFQTRADALKRKIKESPTGILAAGITGGTLGIIALVVAFVIFAIGRLRG